MYYIYMQNNLAILKFRYWNEYPLYLQGNS